jgi:hypothetical protein
MLSAGVLRSHDGDYLFVLLLAVAMSLSSAAESGQLLLNSATTAYLGHTARMYKRPNICTELGW